MLTIMALVLSSAAVAEEGGKDVLAMCSSSMEGGERFITNVAPISVPTGIETPREMRAEIERRAYDTMRALGLGDSQNVQCGFYDPALTYQDGNQFEKDLVDFQRIMINAHKYKVLAVARLDSGKGTAVNAGSPPPSEHADGHRLRFFYTVGLVPTASDTRNPMCTSNVVTKEETVDWKEWGASARADELAAPYKDAFIAACQKLGTITHLSNVTVVFDRRDGSFRPTPHPADRVVTLP